MVNLIDNQKIPLYNHFIGMNPTGILVYNDTLNMNGLNSVVTSTSALSNQSLIDSQNNQVVCHSIEKFRNDNGKRKRIRWILFLLFLFLPGFPVRVRQPADDGCPGPTANGFCANAQNLPI